MGLFRKLRVKIIRRRHYGFQGNIVGKNLETYLKLQKLAANLAGEMVQLNDTIGQEEAYFWHLPWWHTFLIHHNIDVMHVQ